MCKRLFLLLTFFVVLGLVIPNVAFGDIIDVRIAAGEDDAEERVDDGSIDLTSSDLEITEEGDPVDNQLVGMRFNNITIPQGAIITSAYVQFQVDETDVPGDNRPGTRFLRGEAVDNAATFSDAAFDISSRPTTSAEASWDWPEWLTEDEEGPDQQTSDIAAVIQELVDRPGWAPGNSLVLIITGSGENAAESFNGEEGAAPLLHVEFTSGGAPAVSGPMGHILFEYWFDIPTVDVSALTSVADYPDNPLRSEWRDRYEGPVDWADDYGSRARGILHPPADGDYTFWISGDDFEELYLSTDDNPANAALIAEVPGWTQHLEWDKYPEQMSAPITLVGGQKYYIESIMKEAGGGDSMTVAWAGPGIGEELTIIDGAYLSPLIRGDDDPLPAINAKGNIILVSGIHDFDGDGVVDDFMLRDILEAEGYNVDYQPGNWTELDDDKIAALNAADLVIISRTTNSGDYADGDEPTQWNSITTPMIVSSTHLMRSSRWKLLDSTSLLDLAPAVMELADGTQIEAMDGAVGLSSFIDAAPGNGTILATGDGLLWIIEWEAGVEYYDGAGQTAGGPRVFFVAGTQELEGVSNWGEWNLTPEGEAIYLDTVDRLIPAVMKDITLPGDIVQGVPDEPRDGSVAGWPDNEHPALAIDDNTGTKYLHFKGEVEPTGIKITPLDGPSVVTGLTFTTANDATERDPISFELSGSNDSIDGPYTVIASGDIIDFAQEAAWPRFTKNETPITIDNLTAYSHYQIIFTAVRDAASANSMQIAEVELLGALAADGPVAASYEFENDAADISGNGLDGTIMGDPNFVEGPAGMALQLDGVDDYVDLGNPSSLDFGTGDFTIAAWINLTAIERATVYAKGGDNSGGIRYTLAMGEGNDNKMTLTTDDDSDKRQAKGATVVNDGAWHHVVGMRSGAVSLVYVDGVLDGSIDLPEGYDLSGSSQHNALIGAITSNTDGSLEKLFAGTIDDVQIYRRALSNDEIGKLAGNLLANGGFENGVVEPWSTYGDATAEVVTELVDAAVPEAPIEGSSCLHVTVAAAGANFWDAGLQHAGHVFEAGKQYTLSAYLKSKSGTLDINFKPELGENPWTGYGSQAFTMTEEWTEFSTTTPVIEADVTPATITFHIAYAAGDFWVDNVRFVEVK